jgi:hypothetical protein
VTFGKRARWDLMGKSFVEEQNDIEEEIFGLVSVSWLVAIRRLSTLIASVLWIEQSSKNDKNWFNSN